MRPSPFLSALALISATLLLGCAASSAQASSTSVAGGVLLVNAQPGESNRIEVVLDGADLLVHDVDQRAGGGGCAARAGGVVACPAAGVATIDIRAGDRDDAVRVLAPLKATIAGGPGADRLSGGSADDRIEGGEGADTLEGGAGADELVGGDGTDLLAGGPGADVLRGGSGEDDLNGEDGDDTLLGGTGSDLLNGGPGADKLLGDQGDDTLRGGPGPDSLLGAAGLDTILAIDGEADTVSCGEGSDTANVDRQDATQGCERLRGPGSVPVAPPPAPVPVPVPIPPAPVELAPLTPFPIVRIVGAVSGSRTRFSRFSVSVPRGSRIESRCAGRGCPYRRRVTSVPARGGRVSLRALRRRFRAGVTLEVFVTREGRIGKYARFTIRRGRAPRRTDRCLRSRVLRSVPCPG